MRQSSLFLNTLRETPSEADVTSHKLLLRGGFIRQVAAGIYTYLPLGRRVLLKIEQIIREEMNAANAQEIFMPSLHPAELWKESGRYSAYGPELIRLKDRHNREFALGPTHEEVVTTLVREEVSSYRKLPLILYQIQTKFRDERRPRFGLLRAREFLMKDAYSFDFDWDGLDYSYTKMYEAYQKIFDKIGLKYKAVEADAGTIGGDGGTHEFMALADIGEDTIVTCSHCNYAANLEKAVSKANAPVGRIDSNKEKVSTPDVRTVEELVDFFNTTKDTIVKTMIFIVDEEMIAVLLRGDHDANEVKIKNLLNVENIQIANDEEIFKELGIQTGYIGPIGLSIPIYADELVMQMDKCIVGSNQENFHYINVNPLEDFNILKSADLRNVNEGELCIHCEKGQLHFHKGIEIGHVFKLGTKYSESLDATFLDMDGNIRNMIMGCYGIGVSRLLSAIVEQRHDEDGIIWPNNIAPFQVHLIPVSIKNEEQMRITDYLYNTLIQYGVEVLLDDRDERAGVKFKDSDLIGIPYRIVVGKEAQNGKVEFIDRYNQTQTLMSSETIIPQIRDLLTP